MEQYSAFSDMDKNQVMHAMTGISLRLVSARGAVAVARKERRSLELTLALAQHQLLSLRIEALQAAK